MSSPSSGYSMTCARAGDPSATSSRNFWPTAWPSSADPLDSVPRYRVYPGVVRSPSSRPPHDFDAIYAGDTPAWDIGRPQPAFERLAQAGELVGQVLDVGCGTGEHALL